MKFIMNIVAIIPARMSSSRFFGKPLKILHGMPMIGHVAMRTSMAKSLSSCYVATCDNEIKNYCDETGINVVMTKDSHERCTSRVAEALEHIEKTTKKHIDIVVIVQGDEPMVRPAMIDIALAPMLKDNKLNVINLMSYIESEAELHSPNTIKVVCDNNSDAIYFSRLAIPSHMHGIAPQNTFKQVCIMPFRRDTLLQFEALPPTVLEQAESIDMLRLIEHGYKVRMVYTDTQSKCVDTAEDLEEVSKLMQNDPLMQLYNAHMTKA